LILRVGNNNLKTLSPLCKRWSELIYARFFPFFLWIATFPLDFCFGFCANALGILILDFFQVKPRSLGPAKSGRRKMAPLWSTHAALLFTFNLIIGAFLWPSAFRQVFSLDAIL